MCCLSLLIQDPFILLSLSITKVPWLCGRPWKVGKLGHLAYVTLVTDAVKKIFKLNPYQCIEFWKISYSLCLYFKQQLKGPSLICCYHMCLKHECAEAPISAQNSFSPRIKIICQNYCSRGSQEIYTHTHISTHFPFPDRKLRVFGVITKQLFTQSTSRLVGQAAWNEDNSCPYSAKKQCWDWVFRHFCGFCTGENAVSASPPPHSC